MPTWILPYVFTFLIRQLAKFGMSFDFTKWVADVKTRLAPMIPDIIEGMCFDLIDKVVDVVKFVITDVADLQRLVDKCVAGDFSAALDVLKDLLTKAVAGNVPHAHKALEAVEAMCLAHAPVAA